MNLNIKSNIKNTDYKHGNTVIDKKKELKFFNYENEMSIIELEKRLLDMLSKFDNPVLSNIKVKLRYSHKVTLCDLEISLKD